MNYELVILLALAACAFALPLPDEEVSKLQKTPDEVTSTVVDLVKSEPTLITLEEGTNAVAGNLTVENQTKPELESELGKPTESNVETTSVTVQDIKPVAKSMPVVAREDTEPAVPPFAGVRAEPKEGVEIAEAKSTASSPGTADEAENNSESKSTVEVQTSTSTESIISGSVEKKDETPSTEEKPKTESTETKPSSTKPAVAGENKTEDTPTTTAETKKSDKPNAKSKPSESGKDKHDHSSEANKSEESGESKESEESDESNKSK